MTDTTTRAVTVGEAYDGRLWETGTLKRGVCLVLDITVNTLAYTVIMDVYKRVLFDDDWLDYTPHAPPAAFVPNGADIERANITDTFAPRDLDAQREIVRLSNALATVTRERDEARYEVARLRKLFNVSA